MTKPTFITSASFALWLASASLVQAADLLETLFENGAISASQYRELSRQQKQQPQPAAGPAGRQNVIINTTGGVSGRAADVSSAFELSGRVQADMAFYDGVGAPGNGTEIRRARIGLEGRSWNDWEYELELDLGENEPEIVDAFIRYIGVDTWDFRFGHMKEPFSLEEQMGNLHITFMERALPNTFAPDRNFGLDAQTFGDDWTFVIGLFGEGADDAVTIWEDDADDKELDEGYAITARGTYTPVLGDGNVIHLGVSTSQRKINDFGSLRFRERPESHISDIRFVNTKDMSEIENLSLMGLEFATVFGPLSVQAEYITADLDRSTGFEDYSFDGYYAYVSYVLTGESRQYRDRKGEFGGITPNSIVGKGGSGAWEVAYRLSHVDLNDDALIGEGGEETNHTFGLNWYATPNVRFMMNFIHVESKDDAGVDNEDLDILQTRAVLAF